MEINSELLKETGIQAGLKNKEHIEKSWMQDHLLYYLSKKRDDLVFKGGTALCKFYSLPRFSEDLDFSTKKSVDQELLERFCRTKNIVLSYKKIKDSHLFKIRFKGALTKSNTIRIDINVTDSIYSKEPKTLIPAFPDVPPFVINVMSLDEILAEKIHAILSRTKARDLYDLFFIMRVKSIKDKKLILKKLKDRKINFTEKQLVLKLKEKINNYESFWNKELRHFVLQELPDYKLVKEFVLKKIQARK